MYANVIASRLCRRLVAPAFVALAVLAGGCQVNQNNISPADKLSPAVALPAAPTVADIPYGPLPAQRLDLYRPPAGAIGTIVYFHSGGWRAGSKGTVAPAVASLVARGWAVASVEYRLAGTRDDAGTVYWAPHLLQDVDRAIRFIRANAVTYRLNVTKVVAAGWSAGGHLALMAGIAPALEVDPTLPPELKAVSPRVDAVVSFAGPTDLRTFWQSGSIAASAQESLLQCTLDPQRMTVHLPRCRDDRLQRYSPMFWAALAAWSKRTTVPVYLAYGAYDPIVVPATQSEPVVPALEQTSGRYRAWYDRTTNAGHTVDFELNYTALKLFLESVRTGAWYG